MAISKDDFVTINTYDMIHTLNVDIVDRVFESDFNRWDWIKNLNINEALEYYYAHITEAKDKLLSYNFKEKQSHSNRSYPQVDLRNYVYSESQFGQFVFKTISQHGELVAYYILDIAIADSHKNPTNINRSDILKKSSTYEFHLAHFLFFQHINAGDYIGDNSNKKIQSLVEDFSNTARNTLEEIKLTNDTASKLLHKTSKEQNQQQLRNKRRAFIALQRYKKAFQKVREEAHATKEAAATDLKNAYNTYHAQVDLNSSIIYWKEKATQHSQSKWKWLLVVTTSILLTFASPVIYYSMGGASAFTVKRHENIAQDIATNLTSEHIKQSTTPSNPDSNKVPENKVDKVEPLYKTTEKLALASGIADLTGAALIITLMSVLLRLSLRQYNMSIFLAHDAEERVTMLKTYLALSNEGKLTSDGDMKLVLEALFRPSQPSSIPDNTPATPIELIVKAITEKK
ncbi:hypothetical protein ACFZAC_14535 [Pseudomonas fluorescens]|uniref:hypothetical protein n=1 Tax=Pseudomonas fluorescens TaxID=294 RepID=UPI003749A6FB